MKREMGDGVTSTTSPSESSVGLGVRGRAIRPAGVETTDQFSSS